MGGAYGLRSWGLLRLRGRDRRGPAASVRRGPCTEGGSVILNASGCLDALASPQIARQLDAYVTKTITPKPRRGSPGPRIAETEAGMLNSIGLQNPGRERFLAEVLPRLLDLGLSLWVSVGGFCAGDYAETCALLEGTGVVAVELNLSCPNVEQAADPVAEIVAACRAATTLPLYAKLAPGRDLPLAAAAVAEAGADGLSLVNTAVGLALDPSFRPALGAGLGGYSGPALKPVALASVYAAYRATGLPIVGMGGVRSGRDALELIACGASAVALGTVLLVDPDAPGRVRAELAEETRKLGLERPEKARGLAHKDFLPSSQRAEAAGLG
ncbi:MAG: dihydroorotate dehydrogenase [Thermoleophilia bacterium]